MGGGRFRNGGAIFIQRYNLEICDFRLIKIESQVIKQTLKKNIFFKKHIRIPKGANLLFMGGRFRYCAAI